MRGQGREMHGHIEPRSHKRCPTLEVKPNGGQAHGVEVMGRHFHA
jgi:hypothetical protein